jgi:folate-binding protein YgfZ
VAILQKAEHFIWQPAAWLRVTGQDALTFLQGQLTNELRNLMEGEARYGLWLNQKGKVVADSFVIQAGSGVFFIGSYHSAAAVIRERLEAFIIADDVEIADETEAWGGLTLFTGMPAEEIAAALPGGMFFRGRRGRAAHWEWVAPVAAWRAACGQAGGGGRLDEGEMTRRRIHAGIPAVPADIGPGDLPNEGGLERDAISYTKGCYLGQEVMARLKAMGQVRRRLLRVTGSGPAPVALPAALFAGERQVGELRSAINAGDGFAGLAMLSLLHLKAGQPLSLLANGTATVAWSGLNDGT